MRLLVLCPELPHARVISGHRIVYERLQRLLARGHEVGVACFADQADQPRAAEWTGRLLELEILPPPPLTRRWAPLPAWMRRAPPPFSEWFSPAMCRLVGDMVERSRYEVVIAEFSVMAQVFLRNPYLPAVRRVVSVHECETVAARRRAELLNYSTAGLLERWRRDRLAVYEFEVYRAADVITVLTPQERYHVLEYAPDLRTVVIPSGVDTRVFRPAERPTPIDGIIFTGHFGHEQNRDAVRWFLDRVWPGIRDQHPELFFYVVGPNPPPDIRDSPWRDPRIVVTGEVADVRPYLHRSAVYVCPIRMGSGLRGKVLEAMAAGVPVVATSAAVEGIPVQPGGTCLIADDADVMREQILWLLDDEPLRRRLAQRALELVRERLSWDRSVDRLEALLHELTGRALPPRGVRSAAELQLLPG
ncbi:MAG: glycosyltransferase [Kiritimatiellae bacterium]|nr:glycosyltransferase [Kiritimatiellia bacterium]